MKRKLIYASLLTGCFTALAAVAGGPEVIVEPDYFSGFFVGPTGAFHMAGFAGSSTIIAPNQVKPVLITDPTSLFNQSNLFPQGALLATNINGNAYDGFYGVQGGVGKVFQHRWYAGVAGFGEWDSQSDTTNGFSSSMNQIFAPGTGEGGGGSTTMEAQYTSSTTVKISNDYGVAFKPGFLVAPKSMVYGKIGAVWANIQVSNAATGQSIFTLTQAGGEIPVRINATFSGSSSNSETKPALLLGIGFEQFIYRDIVTLNVEYNYANYGTVSTTTSSTGAVVFSGATPNLPPSATFNGPVIMQASANAKVSTLLGGLNFYFGSHWF